MVGFSANHITVWLIAEECLIGKCFKPLELITLLGFYLFLLYISRGYYDYLYLPELQRAHMNCIFRNK